MIIKTLKYSAIFLLAVLMILFAYSYYVIASLDTETLPLHHGKVSSELYIGEGENQPLIVGFGGSEGGNAWASDFWKPQRDKYLKKGYAFLAIGYFGMSGTPEKLDRISLEGIYDVISEAKQNPKIDENCIAVMGGSKGGELALMLASRYEDIKAVVGIVAANAVFVGLTDAMTTSSFTIDAEQVPFMPVPWSVTPSLLSGNLRRAFEIMLEDTIALENAAIAVENINGPIFLISATEDEFWPSSEMSEGIIQRLETKQFPFYFEHVAIDGRHAEPLKHFDKIDQFLDQQFKSGQANACSRNN